MLISDKFQQPGDTGQPVLLDSKAQSSILASLMGQTQTPNPDTLVIYVFSGQYCAAVLSERWHAPWHPPTYATTAGNDPEYMENLSYFLWEGIQVAADLTGHARGADTV